ncbi:MAG: hypothetical protein ACI4F2_08875 [Acutalibacteraceae bacterium]
MELYKELLIEVLKYEECSISFSGMNIDVNKILNDKCYQTLMKIKAILEDDSLDDTECFMRIEEIVRVFEKVGSTVEYRHDF